MDKSEVESIVNNVGPIIKTALGLDHWKIDLYYKPVDDKEYKDPLSVVRGNCNRLPNYRIAGITLDPANLDEPKDVLTVFIHEMLHIVLSDFDLYRKYATCMIPVGSSQDPQEDQIWHNCVENCVYSLEQMYCGLINAALEGKFPVDISPKKKSLTKKKNRRG